ncbi:MAG: L-threonylcarbamoyladenylate synthase [Candidatus Omnitrophica bacterium]|nr:L-threonylcarbamoyladenylate synthase [Candidatus Omnitrophota bacterium]
MAATRVLKVETDRPEKGTIKTAADILLQGGLVAFPTETVYGLGACYDNRDAVRRLSAVKNRPENKPFTVHIAAIGMVQKIGGVISPVALRLADAFWPGPLTLIMAGREQGSTIGFRFPDNEIAKALIEMTGPLVVPSANRSGNPSPKNAADVLRDLDGVIDLVLDGGPAALGLESTVIDVSAGAWRLVRQGAVPVTCIRETTGQG